MGLHTFKESRKDSSEKMGESQWYHETSMK